MDELKSKFKRGCFPTEADYLLLINKIASINSSISDIWKEIDAIKKNCNCGGGSDNPSTPDVPDTPDTPDEPIVPDDPTEINEYLERYNWLQADGSKYTVSFRPIVGSNTSKSADVTMKAVIKVDSLNAIGSTTSVFGSSGIVSDVRHRQLNLVLKRLDNNTFSVGYFSCADKDLALDNNSFVGTFNIGDTLVIEANDTNITINGTVYDNPVTSNQTVNLANYHILHSGGSNGDKPYNAQIARLEYVAKDTTYSILVPAKVTKELPAELSYDGSVKAVDTVGLWDLNNLKFVTSSAANNWSANNYPLDGSEPSDDEIPEEEEPQPEEQLEYVDLYKYLKGSNGGHFNLSNNKLTTGAIKLETEIILDSPIKGNYLAVCGGNVTIDGVKNVCCTISLVPLNSDGTKFGVTYTRQAVDVPVENPNGEFNVGDALHITATTNNLNINGVDYPIDEEEVRSGIGVWLLTNTINPDAKYRYYGLIKYFKVYNDDVLVNDLRPAKTIKELPLTLAQGYKQSTWTAVPADIVGMWDLVQNKLYINNNSNTQSSIDVEGESTISTASAKTMLKTSALSANTLALTDDVEEESNFICFN